MQDKFFHSVLLDKESCVGCTNCIKRCPTGAIRVRDGKAHIIKERCIDCGECIRICEHNAKIPLYDSVTMMDDFEYKIALPAPSFFGQFNNLTDCNIVLTALLRMGFDDVFEVGAAAEVVSMMTREYIDAHRDEWPLISTACPSILRLIRVRFPALIEHLLPIQPPVEIAAIMAKDKAVKETGLPREKIGVFFISPCPAKNSSIKSPLGVDKTDVDGVFAIKDIYLKLLPLIDKAAEDPADISTTGRIGIGWGVSGGEAAGLLNDEYLAADGIENCIEILENLEDQKYQDLQFIELDACAGGCVGGVLQIENPYLAKVKLTRLRRYLPITKTHMDLPDYGYWTKRPDYESVFMLDESMAKSIQMMAEIEELTKKFPGLDCGSCGAPSCAALAEDVVRGYTTENDCIHLLIEKLNSLTRR